MGDVNRGHRPLSPHLMIYRPQLTSMSSIMVRITGIASLVAAPLFIWWLIAAATSSASFDVINGLLSSWFGALILAGVSWALWFHMLGRLRHVIWDLGYGWSLKTSETMGWGMFIGATVLTLLTIIIL